MSSSESDDDESQQVQLKKKKCTLRLRVVHVWQTETGCSPSVRMTDDAPKNPQIYTVQRTELIPSLSPLVTYVVETGAYRRGAKDELILEKPFTTFVVDSRREKMDQKEFFDWVKSVSSFDTAVEFMKKYRSMFPPAKSSAKEKLKDEEELNSKPVYIEKIRAVGTSSDAFGKIIAYFDHTNKYLHSPWFMQAFHLWGRQTLENVFENDFNALKESMEMFRKDPLEFVAMNYWWCMKMNVSAVGLSVAKIELLEKIIAIERGQYMYTHCDDDMLPYVAEVESTVDEAQIDYIRKCDFNVESVILSAFKRGACIVDDGVVASNFQARHQNNLLESKKDSPKSIYFLDNALPKAYCMALFVWKDDGDVLRKIPSAMSLNVEGKYVGVQLMNVKAQPGVESMNANLFEFLKKPCMTHPSNASVTKSCLDGWWGIRELWYDAFSKETSVTLLVSLSESEFTPYKGGLLSSLTNSFFTSKFAQFRFTPYEVVIQNAHFFDYKSACNLFFRLKDFKLLRICGDSSMEAYTKNRGLLFRSCLRSKHVRAQKAPPYYTIHNDVHKDVHRMLSSDKSCALNGLQYEVVPYTHVIPNHVYLAKTPDNRIVPVILKKVYVRDVTHPKNERDIHPPFAIIKLQNSMILQESNGLEGHYRFKDPSRPDANKYKFKELYECPRKLYIGDVWNMPIGSLNSFKLDRDCVWTKRQAYRAGALTSTEWSVLRLEDDDDVEPTPPVGKPTYLMQQLELEDI